MAKIFSPIAAAIVCGALMIGGAASAADKTVMIKDFTFDPPRIEIAAGTSVTFTNTDRAPHTATADAGSFDTGTLKSGGSATVTFDKPGVYDYFCRFHRHMTGQIVVK